MLFLYIIVHLFKRLFLLKRKNIGFKKLGTIYHRFITKILISLDSGVEVFLWVTIVTNCERTIPPCEKGPSVSQMKQFIAYFRVGTQHDREIISVSMEDCKSN